MKKGSIAGTAPWLRSTLKWPAESKPRASRSICRSTTAVDVEPIATWLILNSALDDRRVDRQTTAQFLWRLRHAHLSHALAVHAGRHSEHQGISVQVGCGQ